MANTARGFLYIDAANPSAIFEISKDNGAFLFHAGYAGYRNEETTLGLPAKEEAPAIAIEHLRNLNMLPPDLEKNSTALVSGVAMGTVQPDGSEAIYEKLVTVRFERKFKGVPVMGAGSRIIVHMGTNGELVGLIRNWREVESQIIATDAFLGKTEMLEKVKNRLMRNSAGSLDIHIEEAKLVLYDDGLGTIERSIWVRALRTNQTKMADTGVPTTLEIPFDY